MNWKRTYNISDSPYYSFGLMINFLPAGLCKKSFFILFSAFGKSIICWCKLANRGDKVLAKCVGQHFSCYANCLHKLANRWGLMPTVGVASFGYPPPLVTNSGYGTRYLLRTLLVPKYWSCSFYGTWYLCKNI